MLTFAGIGLDIAEIKTSPTKEGKELAELQLGLDISQAAVTFTGMGIGVFGSALGIAEATAATVSGTLGAITVPLAGLAIGIEALAQNLIILEKEYDASMNFFESVYQDLVLADAFDKDKGVLNLASRVLKDDKGKPIPDKDGNIQHIGRLAPITEIDFSTGRVIYGSITVPKVSGGAGEAVSGYLFQGPTHWQGSDTTTVDLLDNTRVRDYLARGLQLPQEGLKAVVLPARKSWIVRNTKDFNAIWKDLNEEYPHFSDSEYGARFGSAANWNKQTVPGAITWHLRHSDNHGWWLLKLRERKGGRSFC